MATRSTISKRMEDGKIKQVYCHWDGYPSHNGKLLLDHYNTEEKVDKLLSMGDLSILGSTIDIPEGDVHTFDKAIDGVCVFYKRDRGEEGVDAKIHDKSEFDYNRNLEDFNYIFEDGNWFYFKGTHYGKRLGTTHKLPLTQGVCRED